MKIFVNGKIVDRKKAVISVEDRGFLYGDGLFETMRSYGGRVFALDEHLARLYCSSRLIGMKIEKDKKYFIQAVYWALKANRLSDAYVRLTVTRGKGMIGIAASDIRDQSYVVIAKKFIPYPAKLYEKGVRLLTASVRRNEASVTSRVKSLNYLDNIMARIEAQRRGAADGLILNTSGMVASAVVSNIFMIKGKRLITPSLDSGILPGVTRKIVLSLALKLGLSPVEKRVRPQELLSADEAFLTNTLMEVMPVARIDNKLIGTGSPGPVTKSIHEKYRDFVRRKIAV